METNEKNRAIVLRELSASDFEIADNQPDITSWKIVDSQGNGLGKVKDLIFDINSRKVRYIVANLDLRTQENANIAEDSRLILIPIGTVDLHKEEDKVILPEVSGGYLATLPAYEPGKIISPRDELAVRYAFLGLHSLPDAETIGFEQHSEDFYSHRHFDESRYTKRVSRSANEENV